jgi:hypothetical protein
MARAEPSIIDIADSIDAQLRSGIFFSAISLICVFVTFPTTVRPGVLEPEAGFLPILRFAAFLEKRKQAVASSQR